MSEFQLSLFADFEDQPDSQRDIFHFMPKVDLHRHLLGSIGLSTYIKLCEKYSIALPTNDIQKLQNLLTITAPVNGLVELFRPWKYYSHLLCTPSVLYDITFEALKNAYSNNTIYVEFRASWGLTGYEKFSIEEFLLNMHKAIQDAEKIYGIYARLILGITRHIWTKHQPWQKEKLFNTILDNAIQYKNKLVVGFDLSGLEKNYPPFLFKDIFDKIHNANFPITIHCGETVHQDDIWQAVDILGADRIAHGVTLTKDKSLMDYLHHKRVPIEICPTSNVLSRAVTSYNDHPLKMYHEKGLVITLCTDNPSIFKINLSEELRRIQKYHHFELHDLQKFNQLSILSSFAPIELKQKIFYKYFTKTDELKDIQS